MFTLILGQNNSGKSSYAESIIGGLQSTKRYYIATMIPYGEEGQARVSKHLKMRENLNMITLEDPYFEKTDEIEDCADVLLEDVSNLVANRLFERGNASCDTIVCELTKLSRRVSNLVVVSISGIVAEGYDTETVNYINRLNEINDRLSVLADKTVRMGKDPVARG